MKLLNNEATSTVKRLDYTDEVAELETGVFHQ